MYFLLLLLQWLASRSEVPLHPPGHTLQRKVPLGRVRTNSSDDACVVVLAYAVRVGVAWFRRFWRWNGSCKRRMLLRHSHIRRHRRHAYCTTNGGSGPIFVFSRLFETATHSLPDVLNFERKLYGTGTRFFLDVTAEMRHEEDIETRFMGIFKNEFLIF